MRPCRLFRIQAEAQLRPQEDGGECRLRAPFWLFYVSFRQKHQVDFLWCDIDRGCRDLWDGRHSPLVLPVSKQGSLVPRPGVWATSWACQPVDINRTPNQTATKYDFLLVCRLPDLKCCAMPEFGSRKPWRSPYRTCRTGQYVPCLQPTECRGLCKAPASP